MRFKAVRKKYRCKCKFAWLPVVIGGEHIWLERYYLLQYWYRNYYERCDESWKTYEKMTRDRYLCVKNDKAYSPSYARYFNKEKEYCS